MKLQAKDNVIYRLMLSLKRENSFIAANDATNDYLFNVNKGWIESLEWVLGLATEKDEDVTKYCIQDIVFAIDQAIGDDGNRSEEIVAILENEF